MFSMLFRKKSSTSTKTYESGARIADERDQPGMFISVNQIESTRGGLIPVLKRN